MRFPTAATPSETIMFGGFRLDQGTHRLRYDGMERPLRAKSWAVLFHLARHPNRLVTHAELFRAVWPGTAISPTVLRVCIREIRAALGTEGERLLMTVPRRGYRLVVEPGMGITPTQIVVGRDAETARLHESLARARSGRRQVVFVSGEAGSGKTTLLDRFLEEVGADGAVRAARGQSLDLHGGCGGYAPVLDLLNRLCDGADGDAAVDALLRWAPSWILELPGRIGNATADRLRRSLPSTNWQRRLRKLSEALEHLATEKPLVVVLEDLHWSDASTVDALAHLTQRTATAPLLVIGSYRPDALRRGSSFAEAKRNLCARGLCTEIRLGRLAPEHVEEYLVRRLAPHPLGDGVASAMHTHSGGHALFLVTMVDHLLDCQQLAMRNGVWGIQGTLAGTIPDAVGQLVGSMLDTLDTDERRILETGSVVGTTFTTAAVATATGMSTDAVEECCARLARQRRLVVAAGIEEWPDGTISGRYQFAHTLYADVLYGGLTAMTRLRLHRSIGERLESAYRGGIVDVAAVLARHFELCGDLVRALYFHREAARTAQQRCAPREVISHLEAALALRRSRATREETTAELDEVIELGGATVAVRGYADAAVAAIYRRAGALAARLNQVPAEVVAIGGIYTHHVARAELVLARASARDLLAVAERAADPQLAAIAQAWCGFVLFNLGEFEAAGEQLERARAGWTGGMPRLPGHGMSLHGVLALTLLIRGESSQAAAALQAMLGAATGVDDNAFTHAQAHTLAAQFHAVAGARAPARRHADQALALATEHDLPAHRASALVVRGWADDDVGGIREGLAIHASIGHRVAGSLYGALLAETLLAQGDARAALEAAVGALAFAAETGEARHLAELHRLRAECLLRGLAANGNRAPAPELIESAVADLRAALDVARRQKAKLWEERALAALHPFRHRRRALRRRAGKTTSGAASDGVSI